MVETEELTLNKIASELSVPMRESLARKTSRNFTSRRLQGRDRQIAESLLRMLAMDAEVKVRRILAQLLHHDTELPHDIALSLAQDVIEVAEPVLEHSPVLTTQDLLTLVKETKELTRLQAVARRAHLPVQVGGELINHGILEVAETLAANPTAEFDDVMVMQTADHFASEGTLLCDMIEHCEHAQIVAEKLVTKVGEAVREEIAQRFHISPYKLERLVEAAREWTLLTMLRPDSHRSVKPLVNKLYEDGRLSDSLIMRALCLGNLRFFEAALARRAHIPINNARKLMLDPGPLGFKALYKAADMPPAVYDAVKTVLKLALEETKHGRVVRGDYQRRLVERIITGGYDVKVDNMPFILSILNRQLPADAHELATVH